MSATPARTGSKAGIANFFGDGGSRGTGSTVTVAWQIGEQCVGSKCKVVKNAQWACDSGQMTVGR